MSIVDKARKIRKQITGAAQTLTDEVALNSIDMFDEWELFVGVEVEKGFRVRYKGVLYECVQPHTPLADWNPIDAAAMWRRVSIEEFPAWIQPTGAHDSYNIGDKVSHKDGKWESEINGNTYEPGVYGWIKLNN